MKTRSILVRFPGHPFTPAALMPDRCLAVVAGCLLDQGHWTQVWDYGTVETFDRLYPTKWRDAVGRLPELTLETALSTGVPGNIVGRVRGMARALEGRQAELCTILGNELGSGPGLDFVLFCVHSREELTGARKIVRRLREKRPSLPLLAAGPWVDVYGKALAESGCADAFDALLMGDAGEAVVELASRIAEPETWTRVPNVVPLAAGHRGISAHSHESALDSLPKPVYSSDVYPALHAAVKLNVFPVEDSRGCGEACHACPQPALGEGRVRLRSVRAVCDELSHLMRVYGARAFKFVGDGTPVFHAIAVAQAIVARRITARYTRPLQVCYAGPDVAQVLRESGCESCWVRVDTGSQRLLDDFYARGIGVTQTEQVVRACVAEDIFTATRFTFPCPVEDYHSRAETLRIIQRTRPHAVEVALPELAPGSDWHGWAADFGFQVNPKHVLRWLAEDAAESVAPSDSALRLPYRIGGFSPKRVDREVAELVSEISAWGIPANVSADTALIARMLGHAGKEAAFASQLLRQLALGDTAGLAAHVMRFNRRASVPPDTVVLRPFAPVRAAVGN